MSEDDAPLPATNPWRTQSSRVVYTNPWIRVREDQVLRPDGHPGIYGVVEMNLAAGVLALTPVGEVVLVGQWRYPFGTYSWEIIEGGVDPHETPLQAAARELQEEAGLRAERWTPLGAPLQMSNSTTDEVAHLFIAEDLHAVDAAPDETELLKTRRIPLETAIAQATDGRLFDAMTVIALLRLDRQLRTGTAP